MKTASLTLAAVATAVLAGCAAPTPVDASTGFLVDFDLYLVKDDGAEILVDTTHEKTAREANATGSYRLRNASAYEPLRVSWTRIDDPALVVEHALAKFGRERLRPGANIDEVVPDAVGAESELVRGSVTRVHGPFPLRYDAPRAEVTATLGREPVVGDLVNTTALLVARVDAIDDGRVTLRVNVENGQAVFSRTLASLFRVDVDEAKNEFTFTLTPLRDSLFYVPAAIPPLGLEAGQHIWEDATETHVEYLAHPRTNPLLAGLDYRVVAHILAHEDAAGRSSDHAEAHV